MNKQITSIISHTYEINKSKFICVLCPFHQFALTMEELKCEHPKGRHFVYAYRHMNVFDQVVENQSDDGEPKGSSGPPVLRGENLIETAVIIVRYFGGIKLGVGGLVRAYGKSVHLALEKANESKYIQDYIKQVEQEFKTGIQNIGKVDHFLKSYEGLVVQREFLGVEVNFKIQATDIQHLEISKFFENLLYK